MALLMLLVKQILVSQHLSLSHPDNKIKDSFNFSAVVSGVLLSRGGLSAFTR